MTKTRLTMLSTQSGSRDGRITERFVKGGVYEFDDTPRSQELVMVFLREKWAERAGLEAEVGEPLPPINPVRKEGLPEVYRLPLLPEYLAAGYQEENYQRFILNSTIEAHKRGQRVEVRDVNDEERRAAEHAQAVEAQKQEDERLALEKKRAAAEAEAANPKPPPSSRPSGGKRNK